jgi:hypothetical protein
MSLATGMAETAPYHWDGELADFADLTIEIFVDRMGASYSPFGDNSAFWMMEWLDQLQPIRVREDVDSPDVLAGKDLFVDAGCRECHKGPYFTNDQTVDVGTGEALQVPGLRGIGYRAPYLHTGCAKTLLERFDPECGGDEHGNVAGLSEAEILQIVAYLETI